MLIYMKHLSFLILFAILLTGLTFAGKSFFGMDHGMQMGSVECVNHCIDSSVFPVVPSTALPVLFVSMFAIVFVTVVALVKTQDVKMLSYVRLTEPIRLALRFQAFSPVMIRD